MIPIIPNTPTVIPAIPVVVAITVIHVTLVTPTVILVTLNTLKVQASLLAHALILNVAVDNLNTLNTLPTPIVEDTLTLPTVEDILTLPTVEDIQTILDTPTIVEDKPSTLITVITAVTSAKLMMLPVNSHP